MVELFLLYCFYVVWNYENINVYALTGEQKLVIPVSLACLFSLRIVRLSTLQSAYMVEYMVVYTTSSHVAAAIGGGVTVVVFSFLWLSCSHRLCDKRAISAARTCHNTLSAPFIWSRRLSSCTCTCNTWGHIDAFRCVNSVNSWHKRLIVFQNNAPCLVRETCLRNAFN